VGYEQMKRMDSITPSMIVAIILAFCGFVATVSGIILHLNVRAVVLSTKTEVAKLETKLSIADANVNLGLEQLKTKLAEQAARFAERENERYQAFVQQMRSQYADKDLSDQKHKENSGRLVELSDWQKSFDRQFAQFRSDLDRRLQSIEERLPLS